MQTQLEDLGIFSFKEELQQGVLHSVAGMKDTHLLMHNLSNLG